MPHIRPRSEGRERGTWALAGEGGPDSTSLQWYKISDYEHADPRTPFPMRSRKRWIIPTQEPAGDAGGFRPALYLSDDDAKTWKKVTLKSAPAHTVQWPHEGVRWQNGSCEATITELNSGALLLLARTSQDYHYQYYSYDGGETWTDPVPSPFHATLTMPNLFRLSDGRLLFFWCNTQPLPELRHDRQWPPLNVSELTGKSEDVFTNRDANHAAISEDDGKTWLGFREIWLNTIRNDADFRSKGANDESLDKSVHQFEALELPFGKVLLIFGQHHLSRKMIIFDPAWLYEKKREENFRTGTGSLSTQVYLNSVSGNFRGFSGHCAWNRTNGAVLVPDPDGNFEEALLIGSIKDPRLFSEIQGAAWNFPAAVSGKVTVRLRIKGEGLRLSLTDRWFNPIDPTLEQLGSYSFILKKPDIPQDIWTNVELVWNREGTATLRIGDKPGYEMKARGTAPFGLSYLHLQSLPGDYIDSTGYTGGALIKNLSMENTWR
jgi:hypothetical protein